MSKDNQPQPVKSPYSPRAKQQLALAYKKLPAFLAKYLKPKK